MERIQIIFLGTSNSIPTIRRSHTAILLTYKNENILIDCGEGTQRQFKIAKLSPSKLTKILLTHWHGDHVLGLPGLFQTLAMSNYQKTLHIYTPKGTASYIESVKKLFKIKINIEVNEVIGKFFENEEFYIEAKQMNHGTPTNAYSFVIKEKLRLDKEKIKKLKLPNSPLLKRLQEGENVVYNNKKIKASQVSYLEKGRKIVFVLDTALNQNAAILAKNSDLLICESSFTQEEKAKAKEYMHLTATEAATIAKKANVKALILTHLSERFERNPKPIREEARKVFKNTTLANDFDVVEI